jgi:hypothetical protein
MHSTYESKTGGQGSSAVEGCPFLIKIRLEPTTPCETKTYEEEESFRQPKVR